MAQILVQTQQQAEGLLKILHLHPLKYLQLGIDNTL